MKLETLLLLRDLLDSASIQVASPEFEETAQKLIAAKNELADDIKKAEK